MSALWHPLATTKQEDCVFSKFPFNITNIERTDDKITFDIQLVHPVSTSTIQQQILFIQELNDSVNKHVNIGESDFDDSIQSQINDLIRGYVESADAYVTTYIESLQTA